MNTTTATYQISVTTDEGSLSFLKDMPTRPKTQKGIKSQNNKLSKMGRKRISELYRVRDFSGRVLRERP